MPKYAPNYLKAKKTLPHVPTYLLITALWKKANNVFVQLCDFGWADLGTWSSLYDISPKDVNENVAINGNSLLYNCKQNVVVVPKESWQYFKILKAIWLLQPTMCCLSAKKMMKVPSVNSLTMFRLN